MENLAADHASQSQLAAGLMIRRHGRTAAVPHHCPRDRGRVLARRLALLAVALSFLLPLGLQAQAGASQPTGITPSRQHSGSVSTSSSLGTGIDYHGGPVMENPHNVYFIWYGNWSGNTAQSILPQFIAGLSGSSYFNTNAGYFDNSRHVSNLVTMSNQTWDLYSHGSSLDFSTVQGIVVQALSNGLLPTDPDGIYFVLTSADVSESSAGGFCTPGTGQCGYHYDFDLFDAQHTLIKYAFVGNPDRCPNVCEQELSPTTPNGNPGADGMASVIAHELNETVTDPLLNAWFDSAGQEVGDKCAWNFGTTFTTPNGATANLTLGSSNYLVQQNWVNSGTGYCGMGFGTKPVCYQAYVQNQGWQPQVCDGDVAGTVGQGLAIQALQITAPGRSICYRVHVLNGGWLPSVCDGAVAGNIGQAIDGLKVSTSTKHVQYFGQFQNMGWTGPVADNAKLGPFGLQLESVVIQVGSLQ
jgi:hypothetical protein